MDKSKKRHISYEALTLLGVIMLLCFITRLWPILLLALVGAIIAATAKDNIPLNTLKFFIYIILSSIKLLRYIFPSNISPTFSFNASPRKSFATIRPSSSIIYNFGIPITWYNFATGHPPLPRNDDT